jgi:hypothetical protein
MKLLLSIGLFMFALSFCNITEKFTGKKDFKPADNTTESNSAEPTGETDTKVEKAELTAEQDKLLDGEAVKWEEQGLSWRLPKGWRKIVKNRNMLNYGSSDNAFLIASISAMSDDFPVDASMKATYNSAVTRMKNGEVREVQYTEIEGVKGVEFVESSPEDKSDAHRHQWIGYRKYGDQSQMLNIMLTTKGSNFEKHSDEFQAILYSMGIVK